MKPKARFKVGDLVFINKDHKTIKNSHWNNTSYFSQFDYIPLKVENVAWNKERNTFLYSLRKLNLFSHNIGEIIIGNVGKAGVWNEELLCTKKEYSKNHRNKKINKKDYEKFITYCT